MNNKVLVVNKLPFAPVPFVLHTKPEGCYSFKATLLQLYNLPDKNRVVVSGVASSVAVALHCRFGPEGALSRDRSFRSAQTLLIPPPPGHADGGIKRIAASTLQGR